MEVQISLWDHDFISFRCLPRSRIAGSYCTSIFNFLMNTILFSRVTEPNLYSFQQYTKGSLLSTSCQHLSVVFLIIAILTGVRCYLSVVLISFAWWLVMLSIFHVSVVHLYVFFGKISIQILCPFFNWVCFFIFSCVSSLYVLDINLLSDMSFENIFSHSVVSLFILLIVSNGV